MRQFARSLLRPALVGRLSLVAAALVALGAVAPMASAQSKTTKKSSKTAKSTKTKPAAKPAAKPAQKPAPKPAKKPAKPANAPKPVPKPAPAKPAPAPAAAPEPPGPSTYTVTRATALQLAPSEGGGTARGEIRPGTTVEVMSRENGWVRVRTDGWVRESDLTPADASIRTSVSAADLRSSPEKYRGVLVKWTVECLSLQTADTLRHGLTAGEQYLLVRGPGQESALLYLAVPEKMLGTARALPPLSKMIVVARVRDGRSEPAGVPILDIQSIQPLK